MPPQIHSQGEREREIERKIYKIREREGEITSQRDTSQRNLPPSQKNRKELVQSISAQLPLLYLTGFIIFLLSRNVPCEVCLFPHAEGEQRMDRKFVKVA